VLIVQDVHEAFEIGVDLDAKPKEGSPMIESDSGESYPLRTSYLLKLKHTLEHERMHQDVDLHEDNIDSAPYSAVQTVDEDGRVILRPRLAVPIVQDTNEAFEIDVNPTFGPKDGSAVVRNDSGKSYHLSNRLFAQDKTYSQNMSVFIRRSTRMKFTVMRLHTPPFKLSRKVAEESSIPRTSQTLTSERRTIGKAVSSPFSLLSSSNVPIWSPLDACRRNEMNGLHDIAPGDVLYPTIEDVLYPAIETISENGRIVLRRPDAVIIHDIPQQALEPLKNNPSGMTSDYHNHGLSLIQCSGNISLNVIR